MTLWLGTLLLALTSVQDEEALARGQKFLDKIAKVWTAALPQERTCGVFMGRHWVGEMSLSVKAAPEGSGAAFDVRLRANIAAAGLARKMESKGLLAKDLSPVSIESREEEGDTVSTTTVRVENGTWKKRVEKGARTVETEGRIRPGTTMEANLLPLFGLPDDEELTLIALDSKKGSYAFRRRPDAGTVHLDGARVECSLLEIRQGTEAPDVWRHTREGKVVEFAAGGGVPVRMRPVTEAQKGKKLDEPLDLKPAERALVDLFLAIKKNEKERVAAAFDFDRLAKESVPGFDGLPDEKKKEAVELMRANMPAQLLSEKVRKQLPEADLLEETLAAGIQMTEKDGVAQVRIFGSQVWRLYQAPDGERKGRWLVIGIAKE